MKLSYKELVAKLERSGLRFRVFSLCTEGAYTPEDAIWNYRDALAHIPSIHPLVQNVPVLSQREALTSVFLQKIFWLRFPMVVHDYEAEPYTQTAVSSLFFFVLVIQNECRETSPGITRVTTSYHIGAAPLFHWLSPLVEWVLRKNYKTLMKADIPLRERRGELRSWGYDFAPSDYLTPENLGRQNVRLPVPVLLPSSGEVTLAAMVPGREMLWGERADHYGLRLRRDGAQLFLYPRICLHEGAALDHAPCAEKSLRCPWHGKVILPLATFDTSVPGRRELRSPFHLFIFDGESLQIYPQDPSAHPPQEKVSQAIQ